MGGFGKKTTMDKKELRKLSKSQLIELLFSEREARLHLEQEVEEIKRYLKSFDKPHTPSAKKNKTNKKKENDNKPRFPGKPKGSNGGGIKIPEPDEVKEHTLDTCPISGLKLGKPIGFRKKTIIDFPDKPIKVIEHRIMQYICPITGEIIEKDVKLPKGIYGKNIKSIVVMLKNLTNSHDKISDFLRELGAVSFSSAEVQRIADSFADKLKKKRQNLL